MANTRNPVVPALQVPQLATLAYDAGSPFPAGTVVRIFEASKVTPQVETQYPVFEPSAAPDGLDRNRTINTLYSFVKIHNGMKLSFIHTVTSGAAHNMLSAMDVGPIPGTNLQPNSYKRGDIVRLTRPLVDTPVSRFEKIPRGLNVSTIPEGTLCFLDGYASTTAEGVFPAAVVRSNPHYVLVFAIETPLKDYLAYGRALPAQVFRGLSPNDPAYARWQYDESTLGPGVPRIVSARPDMLGAAHRYMVALEEARNANVARGRAGPSRKHGGSGR